MRTFAFRAAVAPGLLFLATGTALAQSPTTGGTGSVNEEVQANAAAIAPAAASTPAWLNPLISAVAGLLGAVIGGYIATRNAKASFVQKTNELEIAAIDGRLGNFIAPYEQLSLENLKLAHELKRAHGGNEFRTLLALLDQEWKKSLSQGDRALVDAVVANGNALRQMILAHGGAVSADLRPHLAAASMHFRMLALADAGSLEQDAKRYEAYVYPRQLDRLLVLERERLEARREVLRSKPDIAHGALADLEIPQELRLRDA